MKIHFVTRQDPALWADIASLATAVATGAITAATAERFRGGRNSWIAQTYVRLRQPLAELGIEAEFGHRFIPGGLCIAHRDDLNDFLSGAHRSFLVGVRADRPPLLGSQLEIVQNDLQPDNERRAYLPLWSQPGLLPRAAARGSVIRRIGYLGRASSAPAWFYCPQWRGELARRGIDFVIRDSGWHDYRDLDLVLAVRDEAPTMLAHKPATKLYNAWCAGVPALLGPEPAFLRLYGSDLDFRRVQTPAEVLAVVDTLRAEPARYQAMVEHGRQRGTAFADTALTGHWLSFFRQRALPAYRQWQAAGGGGWAAYAVRLWQQKRLAHDFRRRVVRELHGMGHAAPLAAACNGQLEHGPACPEGIGNGACS